MQQTLLLRFLDDADQVEWLTLDENGACQGALKTSHISELSTLESAHKVIAIVPGQDIYLTHTTMPKLSKAKLRKAVPYALEEQLADDIEHLHFCLGPHDADQSLHVAVISKDRINTWLDKIHSHLPQHNMHLQALLPDNLALPWQENTWHIWCDAQTTMIRTDKYSGCSIDTHNVEMLLPKMIKHTENKPSTIYIHTNAHQPAPSFNFDNENINVQVIQAQKPLLNVLQENLNPEFPMNLLQGDYRPTQQFNDSKRAWRMSVALAAAWIIILSGANLMKAGYLANENRALNNKVAAIYKNFFPNSKTIVSPKQRIQRLLAANNSNVAHGFLNLMSSVVPLVGHDKKLKVQELTYKKNHLYIKLEAQEFSRLDNLTKKLNNIGLQAEQSGVTKLGNVIQTRITIKES